MAKDKKKKKGKKGGDSPASGRLSGKAGEVTKRLKNMSQNPLMADVVAAALVATAAALKDSKKARQLASSAGDELEELAQEGAKRGNAMWQLALDIGRRALEEISDGAIGKAKAPSKRASAPKRTKAKAPSKRASAAPKRSKAKARSRRTPSK